MSETVICGVETPDPHPTMGDPLKVSEIRHANRQNRDLASCRCGETWRNSQRAGHCASCHRTFYGVTAFDRHQKQEPDGSGRPFTCVHPLTITTKAGEAVYEATRDISGATAYRFIKEGKEWRKA